MQQDRHETEDALPPYRGTSDFSDLTFVEQLALWSLRYWADCHKRDHSPYETLNQAYRLAKSKDAMAAFDGFMSVLVVGLYRQMDLRCLKCGGKISTDEKIILAALALDQRGDHRRAQAMLGRMLAPSALRIGQNMLSAWAAGLAAGGHRLPERDWGPMDDEYGEFFDEPAYYSPAILH